MSILESLVLQVVWNLEKNLHKKSIVSFLPQIAASGGRARAEPKQKEKPNVLCTYDLVVATANVVRVVNTISSLRTYIQYVRSHVFSTSIHKKQYRMDKRYCLLLLWSCRYYMFICL